MYQSRKERAKRIAITVGTVAAVAAGTAFADGEVEAGLTELTTTVKVYIGLGVAAGFGLLVASLAPDVAMGLVKKWVKKGAK
ncbi:MAG: hypothetical protein BFD77_08045 [Pseudomonas sp. CO183]|jgi:uncharacterized membrane protein YhiD involved in acid resistance|nr:MAG: hypothetical protein BFD77_08045 [Pseudomonas sp. CO183]